MTPTTRNSLLGLAVVCLIQLFIPDGNSLFAQPSPPIDWQYTTGAPAFGSGASADLDGDGLLEIVFSTYTNDGRVHCLNAEDGSVSWIYDIGGCGDVALVIYDLDGDDTLDVFVNGSCNPTAFSINGHTGSLNWSTPSGGGDSPPTVYDIDQDQKPEVLFGNFSGNVLVLNGEDGSVAKTIPVDNNPIQTAPSLVDVNFDGAKDIIVANHVNDTGFEIYAIDYATGTHHWDRTDTSSASLHAYHAGCVADLDGDDTLEYVIGRNDGSIIALNVEDGSELWKVTGLTNVISALTVADLDGDSIPEVVYSNNDYINFNDHIGILSGTDGSLEWSYPTLFSSFRGVAISDIDGNGTLDLVSGHFMSRFRAVQPYVGLIWEIDLGALLPPGLPYHEADHGPLIADFDQDGKAEVFTVAGYGTYTPDSQNTGIAFMLEAGAGVCPEWLMFRQDVFRSGYLSPADIEAGCDTAMTGTGPMEGATTELQVYPNPAIGSVVVVEGEVGADEWMEVRMIDLAGKVVWQKKNRTQQGYFRVPIEVSQFAQGVYGVEVRWSAGSMVRRVIVY